ncbi:MAG: alpha/beta hydrolase-fold protein [Gemmatimonadaceae bacterium]
MRRRLRGASGVALQRWRRLARLLALALLARGLGAQGPPARGAPPAGVPAAGVQPPPDPVPAHDSFTIQSAALAEPRRVNVYTPPGYRSSPARRFPVLYMPDGGLDEDFPHVVHTVDSLIARGAIQPVLVVGIPNTQRRRDLTGPTRVASDSAIAPRVGGSAAFRRFLRDELIPAVEVRYRTSGERAIIGESLAGLFIVETFLVEPALFDHYIALDPSVWWNRGALLDSAAARLAAFGTAPRTLYLATSSVADIAAGTARLAALLRASAPRGLTWTYEPRPDLTHATIFRAVKPAALVKALGGPAAVGGRKTRPSV